MSDATSHSQGEVYKIDRLNEKPLTVYMKRKTGDAHGWYRIPSWPVTFLGFEEFDFRAHRSIDAQTGWNVSEATTGMSIVKDENADDPIPPCEAVAWLIVQKKLTVEKVREGIANGKKRLAEVGLIPSTEKRIDWIGEVIRDICEIPDRTSPDDFPEAMLVTIPELRTIIERHAPTVAHSSKECSDEETARTICTALCGAGFSDAEVATVVNVMRRARSATRIESAAIDLLEDARYELRCASGAIHRAPITETRIKEVIEKISSFLREHAPASTARKAK